MVMIPKHWPPSFVPYPLPSLFGTIGYHFLADHHAYSDAGTTLCGDGDPVHTWLNQSGHGTYGVEHAVQTTLARRPIFRLGGMNGRPYIECTAASQHWFNTLALWNQASGILSNATMGGFIVVAEADTLGSNLPIFSANSTSNTKVNVWVLTGSGLLRSFGKNEWDIGDMRGSGHYAMVSLLDDWCSHLRSFDGAAATHLSNCDNPPSTAVTGVQFLRNSAAGTFFSGKIYELITFASAFPMGTNTATALTRVNAWRDYLVAKYAT